MANRDDVDRDDERPGRVSPSELEQAVAVSASDGQVDDPTGGDAGAEQAFGDALRGTGAAESGEDADASDRARPGPDGATGPV